MAGPAPRLLLAALVACLALSGCTIESPLAVRRVWADYNTLRAPAVYYQKTSRVPIDSARVRELRWQYNAGPDDPGSISPVPPTRIVTSGHDAASQSPAAGPFTPLPPQPGKLDTPTPAPPAAPVAGQPPDSNRTAQSRDAWRFIH